MYVMCPPVTPSSPPARLNPDPMRDARPVLARRVVSLTLCLHPRAGILARSGCGPEIDAHDVVFRINEGRTGFSKGKGGFTTTARAMEKFVIDVGSKTTLRMILGAPPLHPPPSSLPPRVSPHPRDPTPTQSPLSAARRLCAAHPGAPPAAPQASWP